MFSLRLVISLVTVASIWGCASPSVKYITDQKADEEGQPKFNLQMSYIVLKSRSLDDSRETIGSTKGVIRDINAVKSNEAALKLLTDEVIALSIPGEFKEHYYTIVPQNRWLGLVRTHLTIAYADNTRLVRKIGSSVEDNRLKVVQAIGAGAAALASFGAGLVSVPGRESDAEAPRVQLPLVLPFYRKDVDKAYRQLDPPNNNWWYKFVWPLEPEPGEKCRTAKVASSSNGPDSGEPCDETLERDLYFRKHADEGWFNDTSTFPMASCRSVILIVTYSTSKPEQHSEGVRFTVTVADPSQISLYRIPDKGTIAAHTACGADTTTDQSSANTGWEVVGELMKQAKAIYNARYPKK